MSTHDDSEKSIQRSHRPDKIFSTHGSLSEMKFGEIVDSLIGNHLNVTIKSRYISYKNRKNHVPNGN